jgi:hypothetical protein
VTVDPAQAQLQTSQSLRFTARVAGAPGDSQQVTWSVLEGGAGGTVAADGTYQAPPTAGVFHVVAASAAKPAAQGVATVTVTASASPLPPSITLQPQPQTVTAPATATFTVQASGDAPLSYQWLKGGAAIAGATATNYTTPPTTLGDSGSVFAVKVSNSAGQLVSNSATLTVTATPVAPTITTQPHDLSVAVGQPASFSVVAAGTAPLAYQWRKNGSPISLATAATYALAAAIEADAASYDVVVSNVAGNATSAVATLTVTGTGGTTPSITAQPQPLIVDATQGASFTVSASGSAPLAYHWYKNDAGIAGAPDAGTFAIPSAAATDMGSYSVVVSNGAGSVQSQQAALTVHAFPAVSAPADQVVARTLTASFSSGVSGGTTPSSLQWLKDGQPIAGATSSGYVTPPAAYPADDGAAFKLRVTDGAGAVATSTSGTLTVLNTGTFASTSPLNTGREYHTATVLQDGNVLLVGGVGIGSAALSSAELYDPTQGTFTPTDGGMMVARQLHQATLLPNGKVLITGGESTVFPFASAELYDPQTRTFADAGMMATPRRYHTATLLQDGTVLIAGGDTGNGFPTAEIYEQDAGTFTDGGHMNPPPELQSDGHTLAAVTNRQSHTATLISGGKVLVAGGWDPALAQPLSSAELYDPAVRSFSGTGSLQLKRTSATATLLKSGQVLVAGGTSSFGSATLHQELYDPGQGTFSSTAGNLDNNLIWYGHSATLLPSGLVLFTGGTNTNNQQIPAAAVVYEPTRSIFVPLPSMVLGRSAGTATLLGTGAVLVTGGYQSSSGFVAGAELYQ